MDLPSAARVQAFFGHLLEGLCTFSGGPGDPLPLVVAVGRWSPSMLPRLPSSPHPQEGHCRLLRLLRLRRRVVRLGRPSGPHCFVGRGSPRTCFLLRGPE